MVTLGIGLMLFEAANQASSITGGVDGLSGVEMRKIFGVFGFGLDGKTAYVYSLVVLFLVFFFARTLVRSPFGLSLRGIREGERRMPAIGVSVRRKLIAVYTIGAGIAGIAGALLAQTTQFVGIDTLGFPRSAELDDHARARRHRLPVRGADRRDACSWSCRTISRISTRCTGNSGWACCWC